MRLTTAHPPRRDASPRSSDHNNPHRREAPWHRDVIIATFENRNQAYDAAKAIDKLDDSVIRVQSGAIVEKDMLGNVTWLDSKGLASPWGTRRLAARAAPCSGRWSARSPGRQAPLTGAQVGAAAAATGGLLGGTVGATVDLADTDLKEDYVAAVSGRLLPGHAALRGGGR